MVLLSNFGKRKSLFFVVFILQGGMGYGQPNSYKFEKLSEESVLGGDAFINTIHQDSRGYIWLGTLNGLIRYDGYTEKSYLHEPTDSLSISDSKINGIVEDQEGNLWITTQSHLNRFDLKTETFEKFEMKDTSANSICTNNPYGIFMHGEHLWFFRPSLNDPLHGSICKYHLKTKKFEHAHHQENSLNFIDSLTGQKKFFKDYLLLGRKNGFYLKESKEEKFDFFCSGGQNRTTPCTDQPVSYFIDNNSCLLYTSPSPRDQRGSRMPSSA